MTQNPFMNTIQGKLTMLLSLLKTFVSIQKVNGAAGVNSSGYVELNAQPGTAGSFKKIKGGPRKNKWGNRCIMAKLHQNNIQKSQEILTQRKGSFFIPKSATFFILS